MNPLFLVLVLVVVLGFADSFEDENDNEEEHELVSSPKALLLSLITRGFAAFLVRQLTEYAIPAPATWAT